MRSIVIVIALGMIAFFGYLTGMAIVHSWGHVTEPEPTAEVQSLTDDLTLVGGLLLALSLALAVHFGRMRWFRPKETEALTGSGKTKLPGASGRRKSAPLPARR